MANSGSILANATVWKPRSQAAHHGYSQVSGMETTSRLWRLRQPALRICLRSAGGGGWPGSPSSQSATMKW